MKKIKIGARTKDLNGNILQCVNIDGIMYEMKYVNENEELSNGSVFYVPSHFEGHEILN